MLKKLGKCMLAALLSVCTVLTAAPAMQAVRAADEAVIIDDTEFEYSGNGDANAGGWESYGSGDPAVTEHWSNTAGATAQVTFNGTKLELYGKKDPSHAMFTVSVDGGEAVECDAYAAVKDPEALLYESGDLEAGTHTALITVLGKRNEASTGSGSVYGVQFVYAKVYGGEAPEEPEFPGYTDIDDSVGTTTEEAFKIQYEPSGSWHAESGYPNLFFDGTDHYSDADVDTDYYTMTFTGTGVEIWASKNTAHANFDVFIDDVNVGSGEAKLASGSAVHQQKLFEITDLENTEHTLKVVKQSGDTAALQVDKIRVYHEELAPEAVALDKTEVILIPGGSSQLTVTAVPWIASDEVVWESSDPDVVSVEDGLLTAAEDVTERTTVTVTAASVLDGDVKASAEVTVDPALAVMNAYVGDEKLLDTAEDYDELKGGSGSTYSGTAWKGDQLNSKIVVTTNEEVHGAVAEASDFKTEDGKILSKDNIDIKWLKEVTANEGRNAAGSKKQYPDIIYKGGEKDIEANDVQFAWVSIAVPEDTAAGTYTGTITVTADELEQPFELTYTIEVLDLVQPSAQDVGYEIQIWQHPFSVANYYLGLGDEIRPGGGICQDSVDEFYFTDEHFALMEDSMQEYKELGGRDVVANIVDEAWNHQSFYNDNSMVQWTKNADGTWEFDYDWYDKWINFQIDMGILDPENGEGQIKCYSIVPWNNQIAYYDEASGTTVKKSFTPGSDEFTEVWTAFLTDFMKHSEEKGWFDITYISMDERGLDLLRPAVDVIESVTNAEGESFKISSAMNAESLHEREFLKRIDDVSINLDNAGDVELMREVSEERRELGLNTTYYTCTGNYPGNFMISDPGDNYWTVWYALTLGTDGYMRWAWDNYLYDMFGDATYRYWEPGDGWYIYPVERGEEDTAEQTFYSTPRYELFKQGVRDVCKAKYLLASDELTDEQKAEYSAVVENLQKPSKTTYAGAAVPANETQRMLAHSETERALTATNTMARQIAGADTPETPEVSKKTLEYFLNSAKEHVANGDVENCVESVKKLFEEAIAEGEAVMADADATRDEVMNASMKLIKAIHALNMQAADKTDLEMAVELGDMLDLSKYVEAGQKEFTDALSAAKEVLADGDAMQGDVHAAWDALVTAMENLRLKANKDALEDLLDEVAGLDLSKYTEESAAAFRAALASAQAVFADETLSEEYQQKVDDAVTALKAARDGLAAKADGSGDRNETGNGSSANKAAKTGDSSDMIPVMVILAAAFVVGLTAKKRLTNTNR